MPTVIDFKSFSYILTNLILSALRSKLVFGGVNVNDAVEQRAVDIGRYIVETGCTVRSAAKKFGVSKSTVHKDITSRLKDIDLTLYKDVYNVMQTNKAQRHIRGGMATKLKYSLKRELEEKSKAKANLSYR